MHTLMHQQTLSRDSGVVNLPDTGGRNYNLEAGFGTKSLTVNSLLAVHDVNGGSFTPSNGYLSSTVGVNARWNVLDWHGLQPSIVAGPNRVMLLDRNSGEMTWGNSLRFGGGVQYRLGPVAVYGDAYREIISFSGGPAQGTTTLDGVTVGLALHP